MKNNCLPDRSYIDRLTGAFSRIINVAIFNGHPSESVSGRCWRMRLENPDNRWWWRLCRVIDLLFFWDREHCHGAYMADIEYAQVRINRHFKL